jgi:hypothetical protein
MLAIYDFGFAIIAYDYLTPTIVCEWAVMPGPHSECVEFIPPL